MTKTMMIMLVRTAMMMILVPMILMMVVLEVVATMMTVSPPPVQNTAVPSKDSVIVHKIAVVTQTLRKIRSCYVVTQRN